jgi:hypothetical protein
MKVRRNDSFRQLIRASTGRGVRNGSKDETGCSERFEQSIENEYINHSGKSMVQRRRREGKFDVDAGPAHPKPHLASILTHLALTALWGC